MKQLRQGIRGTASDRPWRRAVAWLLLPAIGIFLLPVAPAAAAGTDIRFSAAQDYPSATFTYLGSASPGSVANLYRDGHADQYADLVLANLGGGPVIQYGVGGGKFSSERLVIDNSDTDASAIQVGDFNSDGVPDIVSGGYTTKRLTVMLGHPDGSFKVSGQYQLQGVWPAQFQIADLDRDGHLDIATSAYAGGHITILLGNGDGTFRTAPSVPAPHLALAMLVADLDSDGILDLAVTESIPVIGTLHGTVEVLLGNGDGTFRHVRSHPVGLLSEVIRYADLNEDGKGDLVILNALNNDASILYGLGGGQFAAEQRMPISGASVLKISGSGGVDGAEGLQLIDFNGDGHVDMAVTQMITNRVLIFQGDGQGHFTAAGSYGVTFFPEDLLAGDFDGDGCQDLAVPGNLPPIGPADVGVARVSVLLNLGHGCRPTAVVRSVRAAITSNVMTISWQPPLTKTADITAYSIVIPGVAARVVPPTARETQLTGLPPSMSSFDVRITAVNASGYATPPEVITVSR
jgi:hypothetical protein